MIVTAVVQARRASTRLPDKVLADLHGRPLLWHVMTRVRAIPGVDAVVLTTPAADASTLLGIVPPVKWVAHTPPDVLSGFVTAANDTAADVIMRVTGDTPLTAPDVAWALCSAFLESGDDYWATTRPDTSLCPDGFDVEVFSRAALRLAHDHATDEHRQHVTSWLWSHPELVRCGQPEWFKIPGAPKLSVDTAEDLKRVRKIMAALPPKDYTMQATLTAMEGIGLWTPSTNAR
jgi:spore coat polysaccharide biosynthesis protein SpsF (cytidylyltransferase family)